MSFGAVDVEDGGAAVATARVGGAEEVRGMPAEVSWEMLDKSRFFVLGAALFSGVSAALYPAVVLKTHLQDAKIAFDCIFQYDDDENFVKLRTYCPFDQTVIRSGSC
uniref:Uncharacterized protein n=1 Tax=Oryza brachyantha TaxID=4533 RepID=J3N2F5_ORYBR